MRSRSKPFCIFSPLILHRMSTMHVFAFELSSMSPNIVKIVMLPRSECKPLCIACTLNTFCKLVDMKNCLKQLRKNCDGPKGLRYIPHSECDLADNSVCHAGRLPRLFQSQTKSSLSLRKLLLRRRLLLLLPLPQRKRRRYIFLMDVQCRDINVKHNDRGTLCQSSRAQY